MKTLALLALVALSFPAMAHAEEGRDTVRSSQEDQMRIRALVMAGAMAPMAASGGVPVEAPKAKTSMMKQVPPAPLGSGTWAGSASLEIIGAAFPTLPEPYVSIQIRVVSGNGEGSPASEARVTATPRVTMTVAEAAALRDALDAWLSNPTTTSTLMAKTY